MLAIGIAVSLAAFFVGHQSVYPLDPGDLSAAQNILASVGSSFLFALLIDMMSKTRQWLSDRHFHRFFGPSLENGQMKLIYPDFELNPKVLRPKQEIANQSTYIKRIPHFKADRVIDLPRAVAANDLQGAVIMASMFGEHSDTDAELMPDSIAGGSTPHSFVSFGLSSNEMTLLYLRTSDPLFQIKTDTAGKLSLSILKDGQEVSFSRDDNVQHAIVVKYRPEPDDEPDKVWFICAGLGAAGTPAAASQLAKHWRDYQRRFDDDDFVVVLKVSNDLAAFQAASEVGFVVRRRKH
jgi:hypothetical protein